MSKIQIACALDIKVTKSAIVKVFKSNQQFFRTLQHQHIKPKLQFESLSYCGNHKQLITLAANEKKSILTVWNLKSGLISYICETGPSMRKILTLKDQIVNIK